MEKINMRRQWIFIASIALTTAALVIAVCLAAHSLSGSGTTARTPIETSTPSAMQTSPSPTESEPTPVISTSPTNAKLSEEEIQRVTDKIEQAPSSPRQVIAPESLELFGVDLSDVFPPGTKITVDKSSWTDIDSTTAMVATTITRPGQAPQHYTAVLGKTQGEWKLLGTLPLETDNP